MTGVQTCALPISDQFTAAYLIGAIETHDFARRTRTYAYEFAHRSGPGLTPIPG